MKDHLERERLPQRTDSGGIRELAEPAAQDAALDDGFVLVEKGGDGRLGRRDCCTRKRNMAEPVVTIAKPSFIHHNTTPLTSRSRTCNLHEF
jgi:hypothetical protein